MMFLGVTWVVTAAVVGFMLGRLSMYGQMEAGETVVETDGRTEKKRQEDVGIASYAVSPGRGSAEPPAEEHTEPSPEREGRGREEPRPASGRGHIVRRRKDHKAAGERKTWAVGSPVSGRVTEDGEGGGVRVVIQPEEDRVYAPAGGKVTRLFPMGNAFMLTTEFGAELYIQAGDVNDELLARYYRPRILQNEVVGKGKLLLEFDRRGLEAEGVSSCVSVRVENCCYGGDVLTTAPRWVDAGEEILQVREAKGPFKY